MAVIVSRPRVVVLVRPGRQSTIFRGTLAPPSGGGGGVTDHGALTGLADDDHTQYALADGSRGNFEAAGAVSTHAALTQVHGISAFGATLVDDASADEARATLSAMALIPGDNEDRLLKADINGQPELSTISEEAVNIVGAGQADSAWTAGSGGTRTAVSPAQVAAAIAALPPASHDQGSDTITTTLIDVTTTHTAAAADDGKVYRLLDGATVTIPDSLAAGWSVGWLQVGNAQSTFGVSGSMVLSNRQGHTKSAGQYAAGNLTVQATNSVYLSGDTGA